MAKKQYRQITIKIDPYIYDGLETYVKAHNEDLGEGGLKRLYKVHVIEDLLFNALRGGGWLGHFDSKKNGEMYRKSRDRRWHGFVFALKYDSVKCRGCLRKLKALNVK